MSTPAIPLSQVLSTNASDIQKLVRGTTDYISHLSKHGGPNPADYPLMNTILQQFSEEKMHRLFTPEQIAMVRNAFGEALSPETIQGWAYHKPMGYAGDFHIIEKIYNYHTSSNPLLAGWDRYFHAQKAPQAVRNRLSVFLDHLWGTKTTTPATSRILNLASGPGRDMYEALRVIGPSKLEIDCVDQDERAINYAKTLCRDFLDHIRFTPKNVFRFIPTQSYHLIWSAGLFDYFNDLLFKRTLKKFYSQLTTNGKMVIGNFAAENPSRGYMELFKWNLFHRSKDHLIKLAKECGFTNEQITVEQESEGVNLFLVISRV